MALPDSWELKRLSISNYRRLPRRRPPAGYVCLIQDMAYGSRYKIGQMNHPATDFDRLTAGLHFKTEIAYIAETNDADASERYLHQRYARHSARGEWFDLDKAQLREIRRLTSPRQHDAEDRRREAPLDLEEPLPAYRSERQQPVSLRDLISDNYQALSPLPESAARPPQRQNAPPQGQGLSCQQVVSLLLAASVVASLFVFAFGWEDNTPPPSSGNRNRDTVASVSLSTRRPTSTPRPTLTSTKRPTSTPRPTLTSTKRPTSTPRPTLTLTKRPTSTPRPTLTSTKRPTSTPRPTLTATDTDVPTATATATPTPTATNAPTLTSTDAPTAIQTSAAAKAAGETLYVSTRHNMSAFVRACPRTSCNVVGGLEPGAAVQSLERVVGEMVYGSDEWVKFNHGDATAYVHSELVSSERPSQ